MSGLSRTPGKRVWVNSPPRVRIPLAPPRNHKKTRFEARFFMANRTLSTAALLGFLDSVCTAVGGSGTDGVLNHKS